MKKQYMIRGTTREGKTVDGTVRNTKKEAREDLNKYKNSPAFAKLWIVYREVTEWKED